MSKSDVIRRESTNIDKIKFLLETVKAEIFILIKNVVNDSKTDPHYSAVTASNKIKCYIDVMNEFCEKTAVRGCCRIPRIRRIYKGRAGVV